MLNVDGLAHRVVARAIGHQPSVVNNAELRTEWDAAARADGMPFSGAFLAEQWDQVVLAHAITDEETYLDAPRTGRGVRLDREQRRTVGFPWHRSASTVLDRTVGFQDDHVYPRDHAAIGARTSHFLPAGLRSGSDGQRVQGCSA